MIRTAGPIAWWFDAIPGWYIRKWRYFHRTSWRHGSAQIWRLRIVW